MNALAGWFVMVGILVLSSSVDDVAKALESQATTCSPMKGTP